MNCILLSKAEVVENRVILDGRRADHIRDILKAEPGDHVRVGVVDQGVGLATVTSVEQGAVSLALSELTPQPPPPPLHLVLAMHRPIMLKRILAQAAAFGVTHISLVNAQRVEKSFFAASLLKEGRAEAHLLEGLEQAVDYRLPTLSIHRRFRPFVEDGYSPMPSGGEIRIVAHPSTTSGPFDLPIGRHTPLVLAIGPEGGWVDFEVATFLSRGFVPFSSGPRILRVDSFVPAILGQMQMLRELDRHG